MHIFQDGNIFGLVFISEVCKPVTISMSVIVELTLAQEDFELGRILTLGEGPHITLETFVPLGDRPVPFFSIADERCTAFESRIDEHPVVNDIVEVERDGGVSLLALDWEPSPDPLFDSLLETNGHIVGGMGSDGHWTFRLRFLSYDAFATFERQCRDADLDFRLERLYRPTRPEAGPWYGLTVRQRDTLIRAVQGGYYSIPRGIATEELADEFGISDQAVTERLRRAIHTLTSNTLLLADFEVNAPGVNR